MMVFISNAFAQAPPEKVSHAEPLYMDLVRDLGARKGEREINAGIDFIKSKNYNEWACLVEYEFAPTHRLGLEVEADFSFFQRTAATAESPGNKLEGLRFSSQYSFFVSTPLQTTLAVGYTQIVEFTDFKNYRKNNLVTGTVYNPFFVAAKRWGAHFHTLIYASPLLEHDFETHNLSLNAQVNTSFLYTLPRTKHFAGVELNKEIHNGKFELTVRPQLKIIMTDKLAVGIVGGFPIHKSDESCSSFLRIIYEL